MYALRKLSKHMNTKITIRIIGQIVIFACCVIGLGTRCQSVAQTVDAKMTTACWEAYNTNNYALAITNAEICIKQFQAAARNQQNEVDAANITPPIGVPTGAGEPTLTQARGPLNAVATCWFIKGESLLRIAEGKNPEKPDLEVLKKARDAFKATLEYSHGRCWDTNGFFWSPARVAKTERLFEIERTLTKEK